MSIATLKKLVLETLEHTRLISVVSEKTACAALVYFATIVVFLLWVPDTSCQNINPQAKTNLTDKKSAPSKRKMLKKTTKPEAKTDYNWRKVFSYDHVRPPISGHTHIICQAQLKYGLNPYDSYYDRWVDYPLFMNPELVDEKTMKTKFIQFPDYKKMRSIAELYGLDGFSIISVCFPFKDWKGYFQYNDSIGNDDFSIMTSLYSRGADWSYDKYLKALIASKSSFKINGKIVVQLCTFKPEDYKNSCKKIKETLQSLRQKYPNKFIFIGGVSPVKGVKKLLIPQFTYRNHQMTVAAAMAYKENIRAYLRIFDGVIIGGTTWSLDLNHGVRQPFTEFSKDFILRAIKSVMSEPEFKNKFLMLGASAGHENPSAIGYHIGSQGTKTLRATMESTLEANPDIIKFAEWDEQNECTHLRPTIYNSFAHLRIMRYYSSRIKKEKLTPLSTDDLTLPNLILSARKILVLGERLALELLNVPDNENREDYSVKLILRDLEGKVVYKSSELLFDSYRLYDQTIYLPSEDFGKYRALLPELLIDYKRKKVVLSEGFQPIDLRPTWNWDYKWAKQPIRDIAWKTTGTFSQNPTGDALVKSFTFKAKSPFPIGNSEVLDDQLVVYSHSRRGTDLCRETDEKLVFRVMVLGVASSRFDAVLNLDKGKLGLITRKRMWNGDKPTLKNGKVICKYMSARYIAPVFFITAKRSDAKDSTLIVKISGHGGFSIKLSDLLKQQIYGFSGKKGLSLVVSRYLKQWDHPKHLNCLDLNYTVKLIPDMPDSLIFAQILNKNGKLWRSKPIACKEGYDSKFKKVTVFSETLNKPVSVEVPAYRVKPLAYTPNPKYGSIIPCPAGRLLWGIGGGFTQQAIGRGGCENDTYGNPFAISKNRKFFPENAPPAMPELIKSGSGYLMRFNGVSSHILLPQGAIPRCAGFELSMRIKPDTVDQEQYLLGNRLRYRGSLWKVVLKNGNIHADYINNMTEINSGFANTTVDFNLKLKSNQWNNVTLKYDLKEIQLTVNGKKSEKHTCLGPGRFDTISIVGGFDTFFKGDIENLTITQAR